jgi:hypothetical protein
LLEVTGDDPDNQRCLDPFAEHDQIGNQHGELSPKYFSDPSSHGGKLRCLRIPIENDGRMNLAHCLTDKLIINTYLSLRFL